mgnify:CR=1 FL=1
MYRDVVNKHIQRLQQEIREYKELEGDDDAEVIIGLGLINIDHQREQLTSLMADLVRVYNIEPELRHEIADFITSALEDNREVEIQLSRLADFLKKGKDRQED